MNPVYNFNFNPLCQYRDIFGQPRTGAHALRLFDVAIVDVVLTVLGAYILSMYIPAIPFWTILLSLFIFAIILHRLFCVNTKINTLIFGNV